MAVCLAGWLVGYLDLSFVGWLALAFGAASTFKDKLRQMRTNLDTQKIIKTAVGQTRQLTTQPLIKYAKSRHKQHIVL